MMLRFSRRVVVLWCGGVYARSGELDGLAGSVLQNVDVPNLFGELRLKLDVSLKSYIFREPNEK